MNSVLGSGRHAANFYIPQNLFSQSQFITRSEKLQESKSPKVSSTTSSPFQYTSNGEFIFQTWKIASIASLFNEGSALFGINDNIVTQAKNLWLFRSCLSIRVLHEYIGLAVTSGD